jgi:tetratricopeptide (TPR) repeat protein
MILTLCTACAAPLPEEVVQCAECATRYCSERCERYDRRRGGHGKICGAIASGGGAEQYHADKKYAEAVAEAVEECEEDTEGQTCYICLEDGSEEGLVRGCSCRGAAGFAHVSCLARQAKILVEEAEERDLLGDAFHARWARWHTCRLCEQQYHGVVRCALGWACWKTYVGQPEADDTRCMAINQLGNGLYAGGYYADSLSVQEADLALKRRLGEPEGHILVIQNNLANTYAELGHLEKALSMVRDVYSGRLKLNGEEHEETLGAAFNYAISLIEIERFEEAKFLLRKTIPVGRRVFGENHEDALKMKWIYARALFEDPAATPDDLREAVTTLEDAERIARRVFGGAHPLTKGIEEDLRDQALRAREAPSPSPSESS